METSLPTPMTARVYVSLPEGNDYIMTGWWFGTMEFYDFPFSWEWNNHPN